MKLPSLRPAAAADIEDAYRWYEARRMGLGEEFLDAVKATLVAIAEDPELYAVVHRGTRRAFLRRFPYGVYYRIVEGSPVVVACFHAKRNPFVWRSRS